MKNLMVYFLIALMFLPLLGKVSIYVHWKFQQDYLTKTMCLSRERSQNMCKASCQLTKRMTDDEKHNTLPQPAKIKELQVSPYILDDHNWFFMLTKTVFSFDQIAYSNDLVLTEYLQQIFIPPDIV